MQKNIFALWDPTLRKNFGWWGDGGWGGGSSLLKVQSGVKLALTLLLLANADFTHAFDCRLVPILMLRCSPLERRSY